jgi:hypothetical protein
MAVSRAEQPGPFLLPHHAGALGPWEGRRRAFPEKRCARAARRESLPRLTLPAALSILRGAAAQRRDARLDLVEPALERLQRSHEHSRVSIGDQVLLRSSAFSVGRCNVLTSCPPISGP